MSVQELTESSQLSQRLNWLRAGVLGANDGIVSVAATVIGVAAAVSQTTPIMLAGVATTLAGMLSMALGEYVSVSSAADSQRAILARVERELVEDPEAALAELAQTFERQGMSHETAATVARELSAGDPLTAHVEHRYGFDEAAVASPLNAALASGLSFIAGAALPLITILALPPQSRIWVTFAAVVAALGITGGLGAKLGQAPVRPAVVRVVLGGMLALGTTWVVGNALGVGLAG